MISFNHRFPDDASTFLTPFSWNERKFSSNFNRYHWIFRMAIEPQLRWPEDYFFAIFVLSFRSFTFANSFKISYRSWANPGKPQSLEIYVLKKNHGKLFPPPKKKKKKKYWSNLEELQSSWKLMDIRKSGSIVSRTKFIKRPCQIEPKWVTTTVGLHLECMS